MPAWKKICCPIDFSAASKVALEEAAELSWRYGGLLTLLHVRQRPPTAAPDVRAPPVEALEAAKVRREHELWEWRERAARIATTAVEAVELEGDPAQEIVRFAVDGEYDVVVMGTHGRSNRLGLPLGSVAQNVILDAPCPVVVVHTRAPSVAFRPRRAPSG
jgi:nucleotide-binding universal stress UspA family protein